MSIKKITYGKQSIDKGDVDAVVEILNSPFITQGKKVDEFEKKLADYCGSKYAVAVSNGTAALHLANLVLNNEKKDVIVPTITFLATANSVEYNGASVQLVDVKEDDFTIDTEKIETVLSQNIGGVIPVHMGGVVADLEKIRAITDKNNLFIIEDACHALGGKWTDSHGIERKVGDCSYSDATVFSFHPVKQITTGEGGAITTNNFDLYGKLKKLRSHGIEKKKNVLTEKGEWYYEMSDLGFNYRITDIQCALGISQIDKLDQWVTKRFELVKRYDEKLDKISKITYQKHNFEQAYSYHLYIIKAENRRELYQFLKKNNVFCQVHYIPVHFQPYYKNKYGFEEEDLPIAKKYYSKALSLPLYPGLSHKEQDYVISKIFEFYNEY